MTTTPAILVINAGSSSLKFALFEAATLDCLCRGIIDAIIVAPTFAATGRLAARLDTAPPVPSGGHAVAAGWLIALLRHRLPEVTIVAAGHRVVHGGTRFQVPVLLDQDIVTALEGLVALAPLHVPHNVAAIKAVTAAWPQLPQVACFDTAFHRTMPRLAELYPLPRELTDQGIVRYGFHGLSYEYIAGRLPELAGSRADGRVIVAHLGNGASLCGMVARRSVATTMGFTALDGLMMGTRAGSLDPGILLHLMQRHSLDTAGLERLLYHQSGLLGVSGISSDVRLLEASSDPRASEALDLFAYRAAREIGSLAAAIGGLDILVFTAGIGEHGAAMRRRICERSGWLGIDIDAAANAARQTCISSARSTVEVLVVPTDEELVVAQSTVKLLG